MGTPTLFVCARTSFPSASIDPLRVEREPLHALCGARFPLFFRRCGPEFV
jgi:hypothetical protein